MKLTEKLDGHGILMPCNRRRSTHWVKTRNARLNRRRANRDPETIPTYRKYRGWES